MYALPPPQNPPAVVTPASNSQLDQFVAERIAPNSDPELREALRQTWQGSPSFREMLTALFAEQPKVRLELVKTDSESFGDLVLSKDPAIYPLRVLVQWRGVRRRKDLPEPWLASIIFALLEMSRRDAVLPQGGTDYQFAPSAKQRMWNFQALVRRELRAHDLNRYKGMASSGEFLFQTVFPDKLRPSRL